MDCQSFLRHLPGYLSGDLRDALFAELAEHEAACGTCHEEAVAAMEAGLTASEPSRSALFPVASVLERTVYSDCLYVERRLAQALDGALPAAIARGVAGHLERCASCRAMSDVLSELPERLAAFPTATVDRSFTREVLRKTLGPAPGFLDVLRAFWRKPEFLWEASLTCALVCTLMFGHSATKVREVAAVQPTQVTQAGVKGIADALGSGLEQLQDGLSLVSAPSVKRVERSWRKLRAWGASAELWAERLDQDLRTHDGQGLMREIEAPLQLLGLVPRTQDPPHERTSP
jgi:hypothetical protein